MGAGNCARNRKLANVPGWRFLQPGRKAIDGVRWFAVSGDEEISGSVELPIGPELDLHTFRPKEVADLVNTYLDECRERGILEVRVIHGKGIGNLRRTVRALLARRPDVERYAEASAHFGGAGATIVRLKAK